MGVPNQRLERGIAGVSSPLLHFLYLLMLKKIKVILFFKPEGFLPVGPLLGNNRRIPAKDRSELRIKFEHAVHSAIPPDTSIL